MRSVKGSNLSLIDDDDDDDDDDAKRAGENARCCAYAQPMTCFPKAKIL